MEVKFEAGRNRYHSFHNTKLVHFLLNNIISLTYQSDNQEIVLLAQATCAEWSSTRNLSWHGLGQRVAAPTRALRSKCSRTASTSPTSSYKKAYPCIQSAFGRSPSERKLNFRSEKFCNAFQRLLSNLDQRNQEQRARPLPASNKVLDDERDTLVNRT